MNCSEHKGFRIEYVCTDNECKNKFLCSQCFQQSDKHTLVKYMDYYQFLVDFSHSSQTSYTIEQLSQYVHGTSLEKKLKLFITKKFAPEDEFYEVYLKKLSQQFDDFSNQLLQIVSDAKNDLTSRYKKQIEESFDKSVLNLQLYQRRGCQLVMNQITKNNAQHANESLQKLHTGSYEISFAKKNLYDTYYEIKGSLEKTIVQCEAYVKKLIKQIMILSENRVVEKQKEVVQTIASSLGNNEEQKKKRANIQVRLLNSNESFKQSSVSPSKNSITFSNSTKLQTLSSTISQIAGRQHSASNHLKKSSPNNKMDFSHLSQNISRVGDLGNFYFSPQNQSQANKQDSSFSSAYYSTRLSQPRLTPNQNSCSFLLKDNIFSKERSISGKTQKSAFSDMMKISQSTSVEAMNNKFCSDFVIQKPMKVNDNSEYGSKIQNKNEQEIDSDSSQEDEKNNQNQTLSFLQGRQRGDSLYHLMKNNINCPNLFSSKLVKDIPIDVINLSSSMFIITCANSHQLNTYFIQDNNKITLKGIAPIDNLQHIQKSLTSGLFYQFGSSVCQKGEKINIIKLQQLSENGLPVEIIEMRDLHKEELEVIIPLAEYTKVSKKYEQKPFHEVSGKGAINFLQFVGIFQENQGSRTIKLWEMQLKNGDVKSSQICCMNTFQIETYGEKIGWTNLYKTNQFIVFTSNMITKIRFQQVQQDGTPKLRQQLKKRVFKFDNGVMNNLNRIEQDKINCCCIVGADKLLVCTKKGVIYLLELESLEVISITDYLSRCNFNNKTEILKCECPYNVDESDINDANIVRLVVSFSQFENKIYLYHVELQNNLMESPFIFNPILFSFSAKSQSQSTHNVSSKQNLNGFKDMTLIVIEQNITQISQNSSKTKIRSSTFYSSQDQQNKQTQTLNQPQTILINFYKPFKEISKQLLKSGSESQKLSKMNSIAQKNSHNNDEQNKLKQ